MRTYRQYIDDLKQKWVGKIVSYQGERFRVVDVDYNGGLLINTPQRFTETTAVSTNQLDWQIMLSEYRRSANDS